jgi:ankyrin repeat protein
MLACINFRTFPPIGDTHMNKNHESAVHRAVMIRSLTNVRQAIAKGEDVDRLDREGRTPLFYAAGDGNIVSKSQDCSSNMGRMWTPKTLTATLRCRTLSSTRMVAETSSVFFFPLEADRTLENKNGVSPEGLANTIANFNVRQFLNG